MSQEKNAALEGWLLPRLEGAEAVSIGEIERLGGGYSAETWILPARVRRGGAEHEERYVLRQETPEPAVYPQQAPGLDVEVDIQWRAMTGLAAASDVPLAPLIGIEHGDATLGAPFFVMGFVPGVVPAVSPPYASEGFFAEASPEARRVLIEDGLSVLARIHAVDWRAAGFEWLVAPGVTPGVSTQLSLWETYATRELAGRHHPVLDQGWAWLHANEPPPGRLAVSWGDARPGNMIWQGSRCACLTDFENVAIAEPELDLGYWLMFDRWSHESFGVARLPGEPTRDEQRAFYARTAGIPEPDTRWHEIFGAARYCAIVVRVMNRSVERGELPADQLIWRNNPATTCLEQLLAEFG
jgi:aminoglycoside phosphotransferase (APT) family kinase protein